MDIQSIISLINAVSAADIMNFQIEEGNFKLSMDKLTQRVDSASVSVQGMSAINSVPVMNSASSVASIPQNITSAISANVPTQTPVMLPGSNIPQTLEISQNALEIPVQTVQDDANYEVVKSPIVGTFYSASGPDSEDFVKLGDNVKKGQVLCIIEAMKLMNDIESDFDGEVAEILVKNEQMVEYGQPLFKIKVTK